MHARRSLRNVCRLITFAGYLALIGGGTLLTLFFTLADQFGRPTLPMIFTCLGTAAAGVMFLYLGSLGAVVAEMGESWASISEAMNKRSQR
jgi:hypothetical protein